VDAVNRCAILGRKGLQACPGQAWWHFLLFAFSILAPFLCRAAPEPRPEYEVKAAFLLNFTRFIEWPADGSVPADAPFTICIRGDDPFGSVLDRMLEGETVHNRKLVIRRIGHQSPHNCHVLFAPRGEKDLSNVLAGLRPGILTVGEDENFLRQGGIIAFAIENRRVRFDINQAAAAKAALRISSKLLNVARFVEK
jgi:hypothetical protein